MIKKIIAKLEKEIEFLKIEISSKNEIINKFLNNNTHKNNNVNMEGEIWGLGDIINTFDSQFVCSAGKSGDSIVKFSDVNIISHNPSKQLKTIREKKHKEYLHNAGCKSLSLEKNKNNKKLKLCNNLQDRSVDKNEPKKTNNQSPLPWVPMQLSVILW